MKVKLAYGTLLQRLPPTEALRQAIDAERMGFDSIWVDDHFVPFQGLSTTLSGFAWTWMSSALQMTERAFFSTGVTAPIMRYHPAIVAQAFATMGAMYPGRVRIGVGSGEAPNEMAVRGGEWPSPGTRLDMLAEALTVMNRLWTSAEPVNCKGTYYTLNNAPALPRSAEKIPVYVSAIGPRAAKLAGRLGDHLITIVSDPRVVKDVIFPNFEASAREAGKDLTKMEHAVLLMYVYDPDHQIPPEALKVSAEDTKVEATQQLELWHSAEDIIKRTEELQGIGFDHIIFDNFSLDQELSLKVFKDVLPHVR